MSRTLEEVAAADYLSTAEHAAEMVIARYSTSFGWATRLLHGVVRSRTRSVYALVRVADEIVDGAASGCGQDPQQVREALDDYERRTEQALATGFSTDLVIHAFAHAARASGIGTELTRAFFASMRMDLCTAEHSPESFDRYVYGSAEVVGLMCLHIFTTDEHDSPVAPSTPLIDGARCLGAAFQKVNFLRDLQADADDRGRAYFPGVQPQQLSDHDRDRLVDDIDVDLAAASRVIGALPDSSRDAVQVAHDLFAELSRRLRATPAAHLRAARVRVPDRRKAAIIARALATGAARRTAARLPVTVPRGRASTRAGVR